MEGSSSVLRLQSLQSFSQSGLRKCAQDLGRVPLGIAGSALTMVKRLRSTRLSLLPPLELPAASKASCRFEKFLPPSAHATLPALVTASRACYHLRNFLLTLTFLPLDLILDSEQELDGWQVGAGYRAEAEYRAGAG